MPMRTPRFKSTWRGKGVASVASALPSVMADNQPDAPMAAYQDCEATLSFGGVANEDGGGAQRGKENGCMGPVPSCCWNWNGGIGNLLIRIINAVLSRMRPPYSTLIT